jgi:Mn-dependent DtxR family transcriptional regulator
MEDAITLNLESIKQIRSELIEIKSTLKKLTDESVNKKYVRSKELARILGISESSLQNLRISGVLPYKKIQGTLLYDLEEVYATIERNSFNQK